MRDTDLMEMALALVSGLTSEKAAAMLGVDDSSLQRWRKGEWQRINEKTRARLNTALVAHGKLAAPNTPLPPLMTSREVAEYLRLTLKQLAHKVRTRQIPFLRMGRTLRFRRTEIDAWIESVPVIVKESMRGKWRRHG